MANNKWSEQKEEQKLNWKLSANKNKYTCGNSILRIYSETLRKLHMNQSREF